MIIFNYVNKHKFLFVVVVLALLFSGSIESATLKIATLSPEGSDWMKVLRLSAKQIEEKTSGNVKLKIYPGGVMGDDKAVMRKMRIGQLQGAVLTSGGSVSYTHLTLPTKA